jgi:hypothetical protein
VEGEAFMYAVVVRVTIGDADRARELLESRVVPQVSSAAGFKNGYWTWPADGAPSNGLSMVIFESEDDARAGAEIVRGIVPESVTLESVEVREVVASA